MKLARKKCGWTTCGKYAVESALTSKFCKAHTKEILTRSHAVRVSYKIKRIANNAWGLGITMTHRDLASGVGGGEFRLVAAFDSNEEMAAWIAKHPAPKPFVGNCIATEERAYALTGYYHYELAGKVFWGTPHIGRAKGALDDYTAKLKSATLTPNTP